MISLSSVVLFRKLDCQRELEDFTEGSQQLEQELETTIVQNEKQIRDLQGEVSNLRDDNDGLRVSLLVLTQVSEPFLTSCHCSNDCRTTRGRPAGTRLDSISSWASGSR